MDNHWSNKVDDLGETPTSRALRSGHARVVSLVMTIAEEPQRIERDVPELIQFARNSQVREVRECMERGHDFEVVDNHGLTAMHWAAITGCLDLAKLLVNRGALVNPRDTRLTDLTPLNIARLMGYDEVSRFLVQHGGLE
ncbi:MAG: ankyrin repeat domain-containing protein [Candidatus Hydrogenedentota bacterium]